MSSIVRASVPTSAAPPGGIEVEKSPCPRRTAAAVSACTGPATSCPRMMPASTAINASSSAVTRRRRARSVLGLIDRGCRQARLDERDRLAGGCKHRNAGGVEVQQIDALHGRVAVGKRRRIQRR